MSKEGERYRFIRRLNSRFVLSRYDDALWLRWLENGEEMRLPATDAKHAQRIADAIDDQWGEK